MNSGDIDNNEAQEMARRRVISQNAPGSIARTKKRRVWQRLKCGGNDVEKKMVT